MGKVLIVLGLALMIVGLISVFLPVFRPGRLPGDLFMERRNWTFYFPIVTCLLLSLLLSLLAWLVFYLRR